MPGQNPDHPLPQIAEALSRQQSILAAAEAACGSRVTTQPEGLEGRRLFTTEEHLDVTKHTPWCQIAEFVGQPVTIHFKGTFEYDDDEGRSVTGRIGDRIVKRTQVWVQEPPF